MYFAPLFSCTASAGTCPDTVGRSTRKVSVRRRTLPTTNCPFSGRPAAARLETSLAYLKAGVKGPAAGPRVDGRAGFQPRRSRAAPSPLPSPPSEGEREVRRLTDRVRRQVSAGLKSRPPARPIPLLVQVGRGVVSDNHGAPPLPLLREKGSFMGLVAQGLRSGPAAFPGRAARHARPYQGEGLSA